MPPKKTAEELHALSHPRSKRSYKEVNWAIKKLDSEPLLRHDIQWEVLNEIFADRTFSFTAPVDQHSPPGPPSYLNFDQLFLEAILSSNKTTQNIRSKLSKNETFAMNYCKICFLVNIGRINTTLAFYPNMRTALRTYHPVPSLQTEEHSQKEMSDAPRIKGVLKGAVLDWEHNNLPTTLSEVARRRASPELTRGPPTTVVEVIFLMFNEAGWITEKYFPEGFDLWDLFFPSDMPARPRAQAFLTLLHHFLENRTFVNDFDTPSKRILSPPIQLIRDPPAQEENVDPPNELQFAREMKAVRDGVVKTVPAIQKKEEEAREKLQKQAEKEQAVQAGACEPVAKRARVGGPGRSKLSFAKSQHKQELLETPPDILPLGWQYEDWKHDVPVSSGLPTTWLHVKRDLQQNRDPDYDSDEEGGWPFDQLMRRTLLTMVNPATGRRESPRSFKEYDEWARRRESGDGEPYEEDEGEAEVGGSEMGDAE
ncbi:proteophosphoglycan ppg4 [Rhodotorula toruloides]|uniref:Proteophosphoglycan ppg4 n=1 Tax=Rhodotorula toruloides TaxID=5286 RepID=A0A511KER5_RHOTO|nr:proteophosphoglycan ppg4 [Rhodotorula toruloides]